MLHILLVLTGGTICSVEQETGHNDVDTGVAVPSLVSMYKEYVKRNIEDAGLHNLTNVESDDVVFDTISPITTLSENMTIDKWNKLIKALAEVDYDKYDGVIILHGTDTLHMTAPLLSQLMRAIYKPVILVSAQRILSDPESNGVDNFAGAVRVIEVAKTCATKSICVFVVYRNSDGVIYLHNAIELEECGDYSEDFFSKGMVPLTEAVIIEKINIRKNDKESHDSNDDKENNNRDAVNMIKLDSYDIKHIQIKDNVLYIKPYVGINYDRINLDGVDAVLHGMYHSSTMNTDGDGAASALSLLKRCREKGIDFYCFPIDEENFQYSSTEALLEGGAKCLNGGTWEAAYTRLLLKYADKENV